MESNVGSNKILAYMAYGDALGFLSESLGNYCNIFKPFSYKYTNNIDIVANEGQWSYITQLFLINCKCLIDIGNKKSVVIDYKRLLEEIKLWSYYRCGIPENYLHKFKLGKEYYESEFYWGDKRGEAFSRIIPIVLANKNFYVSEKEVYKNIIYINRHPQVILSGLLLMRAIYFSLKNSKFGKEDIIDDLKNYIMDLQLLDLEEGMKSNLPNTYKIKFEQEKINYLMDLDRVKNMDSYSIKENDSRNIFLSALNMFCRFDYEGSVAEFEEASKDKESLVIFYGLLATTKLHIEVDTSNVKDIGFIVSMEEYLYKLREYEIGKSLFQKESNMIDLFSLDAGKIIKHPLLNNIRISDKKTIANHVELEIESKSGIYKLIGLKK